ncbi:MAG: hypothetical protein U0800_06105 [Isosphaeraceae bacterium]
MTTEPRPDAPQGAAAALDDKLIRMNLTYDSDIPGGKKKRYKGVFDDLGPFVGGYISRRFECHVVLNNGSIAGKNNYERRYEGDTHAVKPTTMEDPNTTEESPDFKFNENIEPEIPNMWPDRITYTVLVDVEFSFV